jgi:hypothetical protein
VIADVVEKDAPVIASGVPVIASAAQREALTGLRAYHIHGLWFTGKYRILSMAQRGAPAILSLATISRPACTQNSDKLFCRTFCYPALPYKGGNGNGGGVSRVIRKP